MPQHHFKTEVSRLLDLIIHSLYSHKEIFLRELVSNASDAIDKLRYLSVSDEAYKAIAFEPSIRVIIDKEAKTLVVEDNGIGMDEKELEDNLGTIARSGTRRFLEKLPDEAKRDSNLIGQFGVGFYSAFMVADKVEVTSRKAGAEAAFTWTSDGKGEYSIESAQRVGQGTEVRVHLNAEGQEYLGRWSVESVLRSTPTTSPIRSPSSPRSPSTTTRARRRGASARRRSSTRPRPCGAAPSPSSRTRTISSSTSPSPAPAWERPSATARPAATRPPSSGSIPRPRARSTIRPSSTSRRRRPSTSTAPTTAPA
jgi:hypothetical protein